MERLLGRDEQFLPGDETFGGQRRALLPDVALRIRHVPREFWLLFRREVHTQRRPIVAHQSQEAARTNDRYGVPRLASAVVAVGIEVIESGLNVRDHAIA